MKVTNELPSFPEHLDVGLSCAYRGDNSSEKHILLLVQLRNFMWLNLVFKRLGCKLKTVLIVSLQGLSDRPMSKTVLSIILGGGAGSRLYPLTKQRSKVPTGRMQPRRAALLFV